MKNLKFPSVAEYLLFLTSIVLGVVEVLIGLRIALKLLGANAGAPFVEWIYETTKPLLAPFAGIFPAPVVDGLFVIEFSAIFALVVYALLAYLIQAIIESLSSNKS